MDPSIASGFERVNFAHSTARLRPSRDGMAVAMDELAMTHSYKSARTAQTPILSPRQPILGVIEEIDLVSREVRVHLGDSAARFDVPPDCPVWLHGERIKLRLVQPGDRVAIQYGKQCGRFVVERLDVQPN
jgi:hypothetical protein